MLNEFKEMTALLIEARVTEAESVEKMKNDVAVEGAVLRKMLLDWIRLGIETFAGQNIQSKFNKCPPFDWNSLFKWYSN